MFADVLEIGLDHRAEALIEEAHFTAFRVHQPLRLELYRDRESPDSLELHLVVITGARSEAEWDAAEASVRYLYEDWLKALPRSETRDLLIRAEPR